MQDINSKILEIINERLGVESSVLKAETEFYNDLAVDSLDFFEFISSVEQSFNIIIEDDFYEKLKTVGALTKFVEEKVRLAAVPQ